MWGKIIGPPARVRRSSDILGGMFLGSRELAKLIAQLADNKKAEDITVLDIGKLLIITDYFVICSGKTERQVKTISETIQEELDKEGIRPLGMEGEREARWVLLDYGDVVVHVFLTEEREFYQLERLWRDAPRLNWNNGHHEASKRG